MCVTFQFLSMYKIQTAMQYHFKADNHALTWVMEPVNGLSSANFSDITTSVSRNSYSGHWDGLGAYCSYA